MSSANIPSHRRLVLRSLSILLGLFFILVGWLKLSSYLSKDLHKDLRSEYAKYSRALGFAQSTKMFRKCFGAVELICGIVLVLLPHRMMKNLANLVLLVSKMLVLAGQIRMDESFERLAPTLVFSLMLICRLVVDFQIHRQPSSPKKNNKDDNEEEEEEMIRSDKEKLT